MTARILLNVLVVVSMLAGSPPAPLYAAPNLARSTTPPGLPIPQAQPYDEAQAANRLSSRQLMEIPTSAPAYPPDSVQPLPQPSSSGAGTADTYTNTTYLPIVVSDWEPPCSVVSDFAAEPLTSTTPLTVTFTNLSLPSDLITSTLWSYGDGTTSAVTDTTHTHTYSQAGVYTVSLTVEEECSSTLTRTNYIAAYQAVKAGFSTLPAGGTVPLTATFTNTSTDASSYLWNFGDALTSTLDNPTHIYTAGGVYTVTLTASNPASEAMAMAVITATEQPVAGLSAVNDSPTALGQITTLTATTAAGSNVTYTWDLGDGETTSGAVVPHIYPAVGVYTVVVTAGNPVGAVTATTTVTVTDQPIAGLSATNDSPTVLSQTTTLTAAIAAGSNVTYTWTFGEGVVGSGSVVTYTYPAVGFYGAVVTASNPINLVTATTAVTITAPPSSTVIATTPLPNEVGVAPNGVISATFNYTINGSTINTHTFTVRGNLTGIYQGDYTLQGNSVQFVPTVPFKPGEAVEVTLSQEIRTSEGISLTPFTWQFRAAAAHGSGLFVENGQLLGDTHGGAIALGDLDGDGDLDAFVGNSYGDDPNQVWLNDGTGHFAENGQSLDSLGTSAVALGDLDDDGDLDVFVGSEEGAHVLINDRHGDFADSGQTLGASLARAAALGDVDGDGDLDAFVGNEFQPNEVWLNDGQGHFSDSGQRLGNSDTGAVVLGDVDGDGDLDAFEGNGEWLDSHHLSYDEPNRIWINDGQGYFSDSGQQMGNPSSRYPIWTHSAALGDVDGDGDLDAVAANVSVSVPNEVWLNDGGGTFSNSGQNLGGNFFTWSVALGDLNGDDHLDAFFGVGVNGNQVWLNDGAGTFSDTGQRLGNLLGNAVALGDLDGDGDLDAFVANSNGNQPDQVWLNQNLIVSKTAPTTVLAGDLITYTLTVTDLDNIMATNLLITDTIPVSAHYAGGGTQAGDVVSWAIESLPSGVSTTVQFAVTATQTITNDDYRVLADGDISAVGQEAVTTFVYWPPVADFSAAPLVKAAPLTVTFTNLSTPTQTITGYLWTYGDGITSALSTLTHTHIYTGAGVYTATLAVDGPLGSDVLTRAAYIQALGADFVAGPQLGAAPLAVTFTDTVTAPVESRLWDFGDGFTQTATAEISATRIYTQAGVYTPTLTVVRGGYTYTQTRPAYVVVQGAGFSAAPQTGLAPLVVTFTDTISQPATYRAWDFGDGSELFVTEGITQTVASITATHTYTTGAYTPTLTVVRDGYTYTLSVPGMILAAQGACAISATQVTWWDSDFFYRRPITLTVGTPLDYSSALTKVLALTLDTTELITDGLMRSDGADLRVVYHAAEGWRDLPRQVEELDTDHTKVYFPLQADIAVTDTDYYLYYGNAVAGDPAEMYQDIESGPVLTTSGSGTFTPTVVFTASTYAGLADLAVSFTNLTTPTAGISGYIWTFGDSGTSYDFAPGHTYEDPGLYTVTLTVETIEGLSVIATWPEAIQIPGEDATGVTSASLGVQDIPVVTATICADIPVPQSFTSADGRLMVTFPPGAVTETTVVTHSPHARTHLDDSILALYDVDAATLAGAPVTAFDEAVAFALHYETPASTDWLEPTIAGMAWNAATEQWEYLPTTIDTGNNVVYVRSPHFSLQGVFMTGLWGSAQTAAQAEETLPSAVGVAQSDLFSGAVTWSYPLRVPPGRNGLQPSLALGYNSYLAETNQTTNQKSGWLGLGFNLDPGFIEIDLPLEEHLPVDFQAYLTLNGARTRLVRVGDWFPDSGDSNLVANFRPQQDNFLRIQLMKKDGDAATDLVMLINGNLEHLTDLYWIVTTKEGTIYRFGDSAASTQIGLAPRFEQSDDLWRWTSYPQRVYLTQVADLYDNTMTFAYSKGTDSALLIAPTLTPLPGTPLEEYSLDEKSFDKFVRLDRIDYTDSTRRVTFEYNQARQDLPADDPSVRLTRSMSEYPTLLSAVVMRAGQDSTPLEDGEGGFLRYEFDYDHLTFFRLAEQKLVPVLKTIRTCGQPAEGTYTACQDNSYQKLEAETTFEYYDGESLAKYKGMLHRVANGYGGTTTFEYDFWDGRVVRQETKTEDSGAQSIVRTFLDQPWNELQKRDVWVWNGSQDWGTDGQAESVMHYVFHTPFDPPPFDANLPALTGRLERIEIFDPADMRPAHTSRGSFPLVQGLPLQSICYQYDEAGINNQQANNGYVFVAPEKVTTVYGGNCDSPSGIAVSYEYDDYGNMTTATEWGDPNDNADNRRTQTLYQYDETNWIVGRPHYQYIERLNSAQNWEVIAATDYDYQTGDRGALQSVTITRHDSSGNGAHLINTTHYDSFGNVDWTQDGRGNRTQVATFDSTHTFPEQVSYSAVNGVALQSLTAYDPRWGEPDRTVGFNDEITSYSYDPFGRLWQVIDPAATMTREYDDAADGLEVHTTYASGTADSYETGEKYNGLGQLAQSHTPSEQGDVTTDYQYDKLGRSWKTSLPRTSGDALWTVTEYDRLGRIKTVAKPDGSRQSYDYEGWRTVTFTDELTRQTVYEKDAFGRTTCVTQTLAGQPLSTTYKYDTLGNLTDVWDAAGNNTHLEYDSLGRKIALNDPDSSNRPGHWTYTYDDAGNLATQTDAFARVIGFDYDALNRLIAKDYGDDQTYGAGEVVYHYDDTANSNAGLGRRTGMTNLSGGTAWTYDLAGQVITEVKTIDGFGYTTGYTYDALARVKTMTYPDGETVTYGYGLGGQVKTMTSGAGTSEEFQYLQDTQYNALGQPTSLELGQASGGGAAINTAFDYYPNNARLRSIHAQNQNGGTLLDLGYPEYYADGNLKTLTATLPVAMNLVYTYKSTGWLESVTSNSGYAMNRSYGYDSIGNLTNKNGLTFTYDPGVAAGSLPHAPGRVSDVTGDVIFTYDANGNRVTRLAATDSMTYTYDAENRLTQVVSGTQTTTFVYDGDGNRVTRVAPDGQETVYVGDYYENLSDGIRGPEVNFDWTFDQDQQSWSLWDWMSGLGTYVSWSGTDGSPLPGSIRTHSVNATTYDNSSEMTKYVGLGYHKSPDSELHFRYKVQNNNSGRTVRIESRVNGVTISDIYVVGNTDWISVTQSLSSLGADAEISDIRIINAFVGTQFACDIYIDSISITHLQPRSDLITKRYYANGLRLATRVDGTLYYLLGDHLGSTTVVADEQGNEAGHVLYDPYGEVLTSTLPITLTGRLFTGQRWDATIGLYDYNARFYDPQLGQFTQPDSLVADPLNPAAWNRFGYAYGNPVNLRDPSGHCPACVPLLFIAGGTLAGELAYAGHLYYTGQQANAVDLANWMVWGGFAGATLYMAPAAVGYGMSAAGMDAIGTAVWLNRLGVSATSLYGLMSVGQSAYEVGYFLQLSGWVGARGLAGLGEPESGRNPVKFVEFIKSHPRGAFVLSDDFMDKVEGLSSIPLDEEMAGVTIPLGDKVVVAIRPDAYGYRVAGHEYVHFQQWVGIRPLPPDNAARELEAYSWGVRTAAEVGDYEWFRGDLMLFYKYLLQSRQ